jgi:hypothetical protein
MQRSSISFPAVLILCGGVTYLLFNAVNHDFNAYYRRIGKYVSQLRGDDPPTQPSATRRSPPCRSAATPRSPDPPQAARPRRRDQGTYAAWALGRFADAKTDRKAIIEALWAASQETDPAVRHEALIALARLQHRAVAGPLQAEMRKRARRRRPRSPPDLRHRLHPGPDLDPPPRRDPPARRRPDPARRRLGDRPAPRPARGQGPRPPARGAPALRQFLTRCAIVHSLGIIGDERSNLALMHAYDTATPEERATKCPVETVFLAPTAPTSPPTSCSRPTPTR